MSVRSRRLRVLLDGTMILPTMTGAGRYVFELARHLPRIDSDIDLTVFLSAALEGSATAREIGRGARVLFGKARAASLSQQICVPIMTMRQRPDVYHHPFIDLPITPITSIMTIYDLNAVKRRDYFRDGSIFKHAVAKHLVANALSRCSRAIVISTHTRNEVIQLYPSAEPKLRTVWLGLDADQWISRCGESSASVLAPEWSRRPYVLSVAVDKPHKNLPMLAKAFARLVERTRADGQRPYLWLVGVRTETAILRATLADERLVGNVRVTAAVDEQELPAIYANARVVAYLSLSEGFGLPILEGFASGVPVVASNTSSLPEVGGDGALLVDPTNEAAIVEAIEAAWRDEVLRSRLVERGRSRLAHFTWSLTAARTLSVYHEAAGRMGPSI